MSPVVILILVVPWVLAIGYAFWISGSLRGGGRRRRAPDLTAVVDEPEKQPRRA